MIRATAAVALCAIAMRFSSQSVVCSLQNDYEFSYLISNLWHCIPVATNHVPTYVIKYSEY